MERYSELYDILASFFQVDASLKGKGVVAKKIGQYIVKTTVDEGVKDEGSGWNIPPFTFWIFDTIYSIPWAWVSSSEGCLMADREWEDKLIEYFKAQPSPQNG